MYFVPVTLFILEIKGKKTILEKKMCLASDCGPGVAMVIKILIHYSFLMLGVGGRMLLIVVSFMLVSCCPT